MKHYLAPLEGITGYIYRNAYHRHFMEMDKYFTPFLTPNQNKTFKTREMKDVLPENNEGLFIVPQILTNKAEDFIHTSKKLKQLGYNEVNLNLGCPSPTVVTKGKGSGFLYETFKLNNFLDKVFSELDMKISIKTRIGKDEPDEFYELMNIFSRYPLEELIIHPRIRQDFYKNKPNLEMFELGLEKSGSPVCYNGDIFTVSDYESLLQKSPQIDCVMLGRGILYNPCLLEQIIDGAKPDKKRIRSFHDEIYEKYKETLSGEHVVLFKMKEIWCYLISSFSDSDKYGKRIRKAKRLKEYDIIIEQIFR